MIRKCLVVPAGLWVPGEQNKSFLMLWFLHYAQDTSEENCTCNLLTGRHALLPAPSLEVGDSLLSCFELAGLIQVLPSLLVHAGTIVLVKGSSAC